MMLNHEISLESQELQKLEHQLSQVEFLFSSLVDSEERESFASSNLHPVSLPSLDHTRSTVSQLEESAQSTLLAPAPRLPSETPRQSLMIASRRKAPVKEPDPKNSSPRLPQRKPSQIPERLSKRLLIPQSWLL